MRLIKFVPDRSQHRMILNSPQMLGYIGGLGAAVAAQYTATTKKRTGRNASMVFAEPAKPNHTYLRDRAQSQVQTFGEYNLQRELGGKTNPIPERTLFRALYVTGGDVNPGARPRYGGSAGRPSVKSFKRGARR